MQKEDNLEYIYRELVFADLCIAVVKVYSDATNKLISNSIDDSAAATLAYHINEEFEFLKVYLNSIKLIYSMMKLTVQFCRPLLTR